MLDEHACGDLVLAEDNPITGRAITPHAPEGLPVIERVAAAGTVVQFEGTRHLRALLSTADTPGPDGGQREPQHGQAKEDHHRAPR